MQVVSNCPDCFKATRFRIEDAPAEVVCCGCTRRREVRLSDRLRQQGVVDRCVLCGCGHLYVEKDFNGYVGFGIIVAAIVASAVLWPRDVYWSIGVLGIAAGIDLVFWKFTRDRTVCYRCAAFYRGADPNPAHGRYELGLGGRFADDYDEQRDLHQK